MKIVPIGFGEFGTAVVDALVHYESETATDFVRAPTAVSTAIGDLETLSVIPEANQHLIGQTHVRTDPLGEDANRGADIVEDHRYDILDILTGLPVSDFDAVLLITHRTAGLGVGGIPVLESHLTELFPQIPVYTVAGYRGNHDADIEPIGQAEPMADLTIVCDTSLLGESATTAPGRILANRLGLLFSVDAGTQAAQTKAPVVQTDDIITAFSGNDFATIGYAEHPIELPQTRGILARLRGHRRSTIDDAQAIDRLSTLLGDAADKGLSARCNLNTTNRSIGIIGGPPPFLTDRCIESVTAWLTEHTAGSTVTTGTYPFETIDSLACLVVFTGDKSLITPTAPELTLEGPATADAGRSGHRASGQTTPEAGPDSTSAPDISDEPRHGVTAIPVDQQQGQATGPRGSPSAGTHSRPALPPQDTQATPQDQSPSSSGPPNGDPRRDRSAMTFEAAIRDHLRGAMEKRDQIHHTISVVSHARASLSTVSDTVRHLSGNRSPTFEIGRSIGHAVRKQRECTEGLTQLRNTQLTNLGQEIENQMSQNYSFEEAFSDLASPPDRVND